MLNAGQKIMPTYERWPGFVREYLRLTEEKRALFMEAVAKMVEDMKAGRPFRPELRVHQVNKVACVGNDLGCQWPGHLHVRRRQAGGRAAYHLAAHRRA